MIKATNILKRLEAIEAELDLGTDQPRELKSSIEIEIPYGMKNADEWNDLLTNAFNDFVEDIKCTVEVRDKVFGISSMTEEWDSSADDQKIVLTDDEDGDEIVMIFKTKGF